MEKVVIVVTCDFWMFIDIRAIIVVIVIEILEYLDREKVIILICNFRKRLNVELTNYYYYHSKFSDVAEIVIITCNFGMFIDSKKNHYRYSKFWNI